MTCVCRPGSIIADYTINATTNSPDSAEFAKANTQVATTLTSQGLTVSADDFSESGKVVSI